MKKFRIFLIMLLIIPCCFLFSGCSLFEEKVYVTDIVKTSSTEQSDIYTIYYSDGSKSTLTVENGKDGEDATIDLQAVFDSCVEQGIYENTAEGYRQFINSYFSTDDDTTTETQLAINKGLQSAVSIYTAFKTNHIYSNENTYIIGAGAGVIYNMNTTTDTSYIVTNYHVVYSTESVETDNIANEIVLYQYGVTDGIDVESTNDSYHYSSYNFLGGAVSCEYIGGSMTYDIAVLKVKTSDLLEMNATACAVEIASGYSVGNTAIAIGNPEAEGISVTKGIVSVDSESLPLAAIDGSNNYINYRVMRIDTSINGGNSGGGLFNNKGELIGIVNARAYTTLDGTNLENMAYALPIDNVTKVVESILYYNQNSTGNKIKRLQLGLSYDEQNGKCTYNTTTGEITVTDEFVVTSVSNGLANDMNIKAGDVITAMIVNDETYTFTRHFQVLDLLLTIREGDTVNIILNNELGEPNRGSVTITNNYLITVD